MDSAALHKGVMIENVCGWMAFVSLLMGAFGAYAFSFVGPMPDLAMIEFTHQERSAMLVTVWILSGIGSLVFWYVMGGLGRILECVAAGASNPESDSSDH